MTGEQSEGAFCLAEQHVPDGHVTQLHVQRHEDETFHVLDGRLTVHVDGREVAADASQTVLAKRSTPHARRADSPMRCLVLDVPAGQAASSP